MILDCGKFGDNVSDTATGEVVSLVVCSSKEADLNVMAITFKIMLIVMDTYLNFRSVGKGPKLVPPRKRLNIVAMVRDFGGAAYVD